MAEVLSNCAQVQISDEVALSTMLCRECAKTLEGIYNFAKKVQESDRKLRTRLDQEISLSKESKSFGAYIEEEVINDNHVTTGEFEDEAIVEEVYFFNAPQTIPISKPSMTCVVDSYGEDRKDSEEWSEKDASLIQQLEVMEKFVCCGCLKMFKTKSEQRSHSAQNHARTKNDTKIHICGICFKRYLTQKALEKHVKIMSQVKYIYECLQCHKRYTEISKAKQHSLERHLKDSQKHVWHETEYDSEPKICCAQACGMSFENEELLLSHSHAVHRINKIEFSFADKLKKPIECHVCFKRFETELSLRRHQQRSYKPLFHQCALCGLKFRGGEALAIHERSHRNEKPYSCETCQKTFASKTVLKTHQLTHSEERPFTCETCGHAFRRKSNLQVHVLSHTDEHPFLCDLCPAKFKAKTHLNYHMRTHTGLKPYRCRHCEKSFADHTNRERHEMSHTGIKPYKCGHCGKSFTQKRILIRHETTHSGRSLKKKAALKARIETNSTNNHDANCE
ncbi:zinc finger protein 182-like isoform X2 [Anopheles coustani]|uniref:zinc finger protein 182-like isoform X2 n=2 Tax=coustani group TaxID=59130 RepID=UPI0026592F9B|nr:zinc finger protein 182-like isoform X2 [Anopheles coustani]